MRARLLEFKAWASAWWADHHCIICGKFTRDGFSGYHWSCMRPLL